MTRRSVSLTRAVWWAGLAIVVVALMPFTLRGHAKADGGPGEPDSFTHCSPEHIASSGANCDNPKSCINACASKCSDGTSCMRCCAQFSGSDEAYKACKSLCKDVWPSVPQQ